MSPDYQIITPEFILRLIDAQESKQLRALIVRSPNLHHWIDWCHAQFSDEDAEQFLLATRLNWVKSDAYGFGIFRRSDDALIGMVAINEFYRTFNMASLGYWIADEFQQQGYGHRALDALIEFCFDMLKLTRLEIVCDPDNIASQKLALTCGAQFEAYAANRFLFNGKPRCGAIYSMVPS
ncbi:GNAT family N-acetyltransferase [Vibrio renipiscarius]|uniref:Ribosomal-protein-serine acetyltransferase n=1 Tax=Vibrio renipiscarius TaxID=1461322 RepID=A0A0C2JNH9_9VIBR|nr:GNAT family protein [Vibrio renipiscarius]KII79604.1 ribosomal-protein-serine acetyltransferase [Vibrio renipiscarius]KII80768.1 ribosomal-protein-serine acetyltransferase [Vibrio renipiscarius]